MFFIAVIGFIVVNMSIIAILTPGYFSDNH